LLESIRNRFSNLFTKAEPEKVIDPYQYMTHRPGMTPWEQAQSANQRLSLDLAYWFEHNVSIDSDICLTLRQELFRNGIEWEQRFACRCATCGGEHDELVAVCETCGSPNIIQPITAQKLYFKNADGTTFFDRCNRQNQSLKDVLEEVEYHLDVADRGIVLLMKYYGLDETGEITTTVPLEILALDPRFTTLIYDKITGLPGGSGKICLAHRGELQDQGSDKCKKCGKKLREAIAKTEYPTHSEYYVEGEIFWTSKYFPKFGFPPVFKIIDDAWAYHYLEKRVRNYYEKGRPPAILEVPSNNIPSVAKMMSDMSAQLMQNPDYFPWVATDPMSHKGLTVVNMMSDPTPEMLEVKADIRQRFGSFYGVMPLFQGDVGSSGGLNNESRQLEVSNRAFTRGQGIFNDKFFPWLLHQFAITDWKLVLVPAEDADELAEEQIISAQFDNMKKALDMGMEVEYKTGKVHYSGSPQKAQPLMPPLNLDNGLGDSEDKQGENLPEEQKEEAPFSEQEPDVNTVEDNETPEQLKEKSDDELAGLSHEDYINTITPAPFLKSSRDFIVQALLKIQQYTDFANLAPQEAEGVYHSIIDIMTKPEGWNLDQVSRNLMRRYPQLSYFESERIARTETTAIANKARELDFNESQPLDTTYYWGGPDDDRTSDVCREIKDRLNGKGLPLSALKALVNEVSLKYGMKPRDWTPHPNCRHTLRIWFGDM
jgi:hypothetical protein